MKNLIDSASSRAPIWIPRPEIGRSQGTMLNLVNLLLRETNHRLATLEKCGGKDPELFVVTRVNWRDSDLSKPILCQLPSILSLLETLRGTKGVPREVYLDSMEGVAVYLPTGLRISQMPMDAKECVRLLMGLVEDSLVHMYSTKREVEKWFWKAARQQGFSPEIVERMARNEPHFDSQASKQRFHELLTAYFSVRFRVHSGESCLFVEE